MVARSVRPLLPRSGGESDDPSRVSASAAATVSGLPPRRKYAVAAACQACKSKKIRCDGYRPRCGVCIKKGRCCEYQVGPGRTRKEQMEMEQQGLRDNVESFASLYQYLQSRPTAEANALFERIRSGATLGAALDFVKSREDGKSPRSPQSPQSPQPPKVEWSQRIHDSNRLFECKLLSAHRSEIGRKALLDGVERFFKYLGTMFPIITENEVYTLMATFLTPLPEEDARQDETQDNLIVQKKIAYGELLAICAVGFQYDRQTLPNGDASICTPFYHKARLFLDYVMENAPLQAMRMCCCLSIYNVIAKASLAVSYTDWGIILGATNGLAGGQEQSSLSQEDHTKCLKTFKALVTVRSWLTATLGHIPSPEIARCIHETGDLMENTGVSDRTGQNAVIDVLQQNMAKITILKANILRTTACFRTLSSTTLKGMREDLEQWRSSLPDYMRLEALVESPKMSPNQRRVTFYMHLFYLSAIMLKSRALLAPQDPVVPLPTTPEGRTAILEGMHAARISARTLRLIYDEKAIVKNCWLTMYQCYITYLMLNYAGVKSFVAKADSNLREHDAALSGTCIDILKLCATKDRIGQRFHTRLLKIQARLSQRLPMCTGPASGGSDTYDDSYLFVKTDAETELQLIMHDILLMLCYPLTRLHERAGDVLQYPAIAEAYVNADANFVHHLASPFNMGEDVVPDGLLPPEGSLKERYDHDEGDEGFIADSEPYGWKASAWDPSPEVACILQPCCD